MDQKELVSNWDELVYIQKIRYWVAYFMMFISK